MPYPVIPETITVHLGAPDEAAANVTVPFVDYIKNVASSEIYPTWPESAIRANVLAQVTYAMNRIYTEWYRSRGYDFDITNNTQYDQAFTPGREIFENIGQVVDELFNDYVVRQGNVQPFFTQYCNGSTSTCPGLSQWGTVFLANNGQTPYQILQYYYGQDIGIVEDAPVGGNVPSYPGVSLRFGDFGEEVRTIQRQLNRIRRDYPSITQIYDTSGVFDQRTEQAVKDFQRIFDLEQDGIVGKSTWYKIKMVYNAVKKLADLNSEGITLSEADRLYPSVLRPGDSRNGVRAVQYYLAFTNFFLFDMPILTLDGIYGPETEQAVRRFQRAYGLPVTGEVNYQTFIFLVRAYEEIVSALPPEYQTSREELYPGQFLTIGSEGEQVRQLQEYINAIGERDGGLPRLTVDGVYGQETDRAVRIIQQKEGFTPTGSVGPLTWLGILNLYKGT
ncbi:MAG: spore cortex-lytic protein [Clostridiales bacterium]|nr:spore cortex-lytic protein [Clostridiales bacterium]